MSIRSDHWIRQKALAAVDADLNATIDYVMGMGLGLGSVGVFLDTSGINAAGEEIAIFPVLETVAPSVAEAYELDHRGLDEAAERLGEAIAADTWIEDIRMRLYQVMDNLINMTNDGDDVFCINIHISDHRHCTRCYLTIHHHYHQITLLTYLLLFS